ncbi:MAG: DNA polymerase III subunit chi [Gammaproteobacteria bacterium]|nr:MAG: DNA polymerase III subunit chi [Gammaproteobacteria bacterium]
MTRIDFYILSNNRQNDKELLACKITEKAYLAGHEIFIYTAETAQSQVIDSMLWTFRQGSFLPHEIQNSAETHKNNPIVISDQNPIAIKSEVMINLSEQITDFFSSYERVAEIVPNNETSKAKARERYKFYKDRGYHLNTHNLEV